MSIIDVIKVPIPKVRKTMASPTKIIKNPKKEIMKNYCRKSKNRKYDED